LLVTVKDEGQKRDAHETRTGGLKGKINKTRKRRQMATSQDWLQSNRALKTTEGRPLLFRIFLCV
jgi:hypothetical protein